MKCNKCGNEINDGAVFCDNCGNKLENKPKQFCGNCGTQLMYDADFCGNCGFPTKIDVIPMENVRFDNDVPLKKKRNILKVVIVLLLIIALASAILIGYVIYERNNGDVEEQPRTNNHFIQNNSSAENSNSVISCEVDENERTENERKDEVGSVVRTAVTDVENKVLTIRNWYNNTQNKLQTLSTVDVAKGRIEYYDNAKRVRVDFLADDKNTYTRFYYFKDDKLYFVFAFDGTKENRLYFDNDMLFRWIDENGQIHDNDFANNEFMLWENRILNELALLR